MPDERPAQDVGSPPASNPPAAPTAAAPSSPSPAGRSDFERDLVDWMGDIGERVDALGQAVKALIGAETQVIQHGAGGTPAAAPPAASQTTVQAAGAVAQEAATRAKRKIGLLW